MKPSDENRRFWARWALDPVLGLIDGALVEGLSEDGLFRITPSSRPPSGLTDERVFDDHILTPGFLNAHCHLDYSYLSGTLPGEGGFIPWLKAMIGARRSFGTQDEPVALSAAHDAVAESLADGVTEIWDIRSFGWGESEMREAGCRGISFHEWVAPDPDHWEPQWEEFAHNCLQSLAETHAHADRILTALSVHSFYSVCAAAVETSVRWGRQRHLPMAIHLAESPEEIELLTQARGGLYKLLCGFPRPHRFRHMTNSDQAPIERAHDFGLLGPATLSIHCNLPQPGEAELLAESGTVVIFCPRSHDFFGYPPYPLEKYRRLGIRLALGTDSLASNSSLSMRAEARRLAKLAPDWPPLEILACLTGASLGEIEPFGGRGRLIGAPCRSWALWRPVAIPAKHDNPGRLLSLILDPHTHLVKSSTREL